MPSPPHDVFREQLSSLFYGHALWVPDPAPLYQQVSIGDVGYVRDGYFVRMFNVLLDWNDPLNRTFCEPEQYASLDMGPFINIRKSKFSKGPYYSRLVSSEEHTNVGALNPDEQNVTVYSCMRRQGALLMLPYDGLHEDVIRTKVFEDYIRDHVDSWFSLSKKKGLGVDRMEDLILVTGCTLVTSWGAAAFLDNSADAEFTLAVQLLNGGGATYDWRVIRPSVVHGDSYRGPFAGNLPQNQCVFIRGFRAKRVFLWTRLRGAAEPLPDDPEPPSGPEGEIQVTRVADAPSHRDPLTGVLDYILEKCPENTLAIAHDDDLQQVVIGEQDTLTADAVESFFSQKETNILVENEAAILQDEEEAVVPDEVKAIFYAAAELAGELVPLVLHPVLSKYLLKLDIGNQPPDHTYDLPDEELNSPAVNPPISSLKLENHQGYPQMITVQSSSVISVYDVLKTIHEDVRKQSRRREWTRLSAEERAVVDGSFRERCKTEEELGQGPCRIDYLRGRDRLQILPRLSPDGEMLPAPIIPEEVLREALDSSRDESNVAGPSRNPIR